MFDKDIFRFPTARDWFDIQGYVHRGFEDVREAFEQNFVRRGELGGACCVYVRGEKVVDLWGGIRNKHSGEPWEENTMVVVHSTTKGLAAMTLALAHSRGWLDYEERVCTYWPEFAQNGKERITVRQLLAHQAGLFAIDEPVDRTVVADLDRLAVVLARQKPAWEPGTRQAYHALTLGFYEGELLRRVDPQHRSLGQFFQDEIASRLGEDVYLRLPENPGAGIYQDAQRIYARNLEVPSGNGVATARGIAHAYSVLAGDGHELGLRKETLDLLAAPAIPPARGFYDECLKVTGAQFSLGFMKSSRVWPFGSSKAFGAPGAGGSLGFADPACGVGYAYVTSQARARLTGDPRDVALRNALYSAIGDSSRTAPVAA